MDQESELTVNINAAIDACRHDSDDHNLPEVASVLAGVPSEQVADYRRSIERIDRAVAGAMQEVLVPNGLAERILAGLHAPASGILGDQELLARPSETGAKLNRPGIEPGVAAEVGKRAAPRPSPRFVLTTAVVAMAAGLLIVLVWQGTREKLDTGELQVRAKAFYEADDHGAPLSDASSSIVPVAAQTVVGWRPVTFLSRPGSAFELSGRGRVKGTLYVIPLSSFCGPVLSGLPTTPSAQGTSGMTVAVWTVGKDVYVMVVKGDQEAFASFFAQKFA